MAVLLPVVLISVAGTSFASWRCRFDGVARLTCCCPKQTSSVQQPTDSDARATVSPLGCCEVERHVFDKAPSDLARGAPTALVPAAVGLPVGVLTSPPTASPTISLREPEPDHHSAGRELLLRKQTFLI